GVAQPHRQLPDALDGVGMDLGVVGLELGGAAQLAHGILIVVEDDDVHDRARRLCPLLHTEPAHASIRFHHHRGIVPRRARVMSISMYTASVPVFVKTLTNMLRWLDKAQEHAKARNFDPAVYLTLRLYPDMLPLPAQIRIAGDSAKGCAA